MVWIFALFNIAMFAVTVLATLGGAGVLPGLRPGFPFGPDFGALAALTLWALGDVILALIWRLRR